MLDLSSGRNLASYDLLVGEELVRYHFGYQCALPFGEKVRERLPDCSALLLLTDSRTQSHAVPVLAALRREFRVVQVVVDPRERSKTLGLVGSLLEQAIDAGIGRDAAIVAMGGGVVGNIGGMVAALLYRGVPLVHLPTTPVAAFDAVLSAKQAVNLSRGKNLCGTFLVPSLIACDLAWLHTVPADELMTGIVEMVKNVLAVRPQDTDRLAAAISSVRTDPEAALRTLLDIGVRAKQPFMAQDPKERFGALAFEYGHTVGHAIEFASDGTITHGEAVGWGMLVAAAVARQVCGLSRADERQHHEILAGIGLSRRRLRAVDPAAVKELLGTDNKRGYLDIGPHDVAMVLLESVGRPLISASRPLVGVSRSLLELSIDSLFRY